MNDFISKPITGQDPYQVLLKWLDAQAEARHAAYAGSLNPYTTGK